MTFQKQLGMSSSQLTNSIIFQRGRSTTKQCRSAGADPKDLDDGDIGGELARASGLSEVRLPVRLGEGLGRFMNSIGIWS